MPAKQLAAAILTILAAAGPMAAGAAETAITVKANMARVLKLSAPAATVIIGNPGVADVTIQDPVTLVLTGKSFGQTNLIVLDSLGNPIADTLIQVVQAQSDVVTVFQGQARTSVACAPQCEPTVMLGDDANYSGNVLASANIFESAAAQ